MQKILAAALAAVSFAVPALAEPEIKDNEWNTPHSLGCMLLRECTLGVVQIKEYDDLEALFHYNANPEVAEEFKDLLYEMNRIGIGVFVADAKYFPPGHRGVYHTVGNNFFLNYTHLRDPLAVLSVMRHEGWHAAQDCMAGSIENNSIAIIHMPDLVPQQHNLRAEIAYAATPSAIPWEREAIWAGATPYMTANALRACGAADAMWDIYPPTPKTGEWLINNGYWDGQPK